MNNAQPTKRSAFISIMAMLLCIAMLLGTTFAWFTDKVTSAGNKIESGNLQIDLLHKDGDSWVSVKDNPEHKIFDYENWEPGYTQVETLKVENLGSLALQYKLSLTVEADSAELGENGENLADVIEVYVTHGERTANSFADIQSSEFWSYRGTLSEVFADPATFLSGCIVPAGQGFDDVTITTTVGEQTVMIALHMQESAENEYQELSVGNIYVNLVATQWGYESDNFGTDYDQGAVFPELTVGGINIPVTNNNGRTAEEVTAVGTGMKAIIPAGVALESGASVLNLSVEEMQGTQTNITLNDGEALRSLDVHVAGISANNTVPVLVTVENALAVGLNIGNYTLYHVENGVSNEMIPVTSLDELDAHNEFYYDPATGEVTLAMATFSEVAFRAAPAKWAGNRDYSWYDASKTEFVIANADQLAGLSAIVGGMAKRSDNGDIYTSECVDGATVVRDSFAGKTIKLVADIRIGDVADDQCSDPSENGIVFYPIGYWNSEEKYERYENVDDRTALESGFYTFEGTFDGNGHTISDWYQNTWEMKGDHNWYNNKTEQYYRDGMGLFGRVYKGTVKNLTVKNFSSDGEIATTGSIAAYADGATFENIAIFNCNPRVYNIGNGGIVGCVGWYAKEADLKTTFKNITVDNSNKISALWGSYDVACGGIVGQYYPISGQTSVGTPTNGGMYLENCHVAAIMDVNNDVCGNYQYYAYRYAGILIGSVRENVRGEDGREYPDMTGITASGCTVHFGTWNDYYYCEFEKNGHPSYSGPDDYKFSRISHSEINFTDTNGNGIIDTKAERDSVTGCKHAHTAAEDNQCVYLPFNNLVTGYGWGVTSKGVEDMEGVTILDRVEGTSVEKFEGKVTTLTNNRVYTFDEIFTLLNTGVELVPGALTVTVTKLDENGTVSETIEYDRDNWANGTIAFTGTGTVKITIQDYYFCTPTEIEVTVTERQQAEKFVSKIPVGNNGVGNKQPVTLDSLFAIKDGEKIEKLGIEVTAKTTSVSGVYDADIAFATGKISFTGTGVVTVKVWDEGDSYCLPTELTLNVRDAAQMLAEELGLVIDVPFVTTAPTLDGVVKEGEYPVSKATKVDDLYNGDGDGHVAKGTEVVEYFAHDANYIYYAVVVTRTQINKAFYPHIKMENSFAPVYTNRIDNDQTCRIDYRMNANMDTYCNQTYGYGNYSALIPIKVSNSDIYNDNPNSWCKGGRVAIDNAYEETFELKIAKTAFSPLGTVKVVPYTTTFQNQCATGKTVSAADIAKIQAAGFEVPAEGTCAYYYMNLEPNWEQVTDSMGLNTNIVKDTTATHTVDGLIGTGEYATVKETLVKDLTGDTQHLTSEKFVEYFAHDDDYIYYAAQFAENLADGIGAFWLEFKVDNTFDIYNDNRVLKDYYYARAGAQLRHYIRDNGANGCYINGGISAHAGYELPTYDASNGYETKYEFSYAATKDANGLKTYEVRISKDYLARINGCQKEDIKTIAYFISFTAEASTYNDLSQADMQKLVDAGATYIPDKSYNFMVFN